MEEFAGESLGNQNTLKMIIKGLLVQMAPLIE